MRKIKSKMDRALIYVYVKGIKGKEKCIQLIKTNKGEGFIDTAGASVRA